MNSAILPEFTDILFCTLLTMQAEAAPSAEGYPTGLAWYGKFRNPNQTKPQTEPSWSQRLAELLSKASYPTIPENPYPAISGQPRVQFCDNVITLPDGSTLWLENKGAWKTYWRQRGNVAKFRSHLFTSNNSAAHDVTKIATLCRPSANYIGILLLGFDSLDDPMGGDIDEFRITAQLNSADWTEASMHLPDRWRPRERVHAWFWWRPA